MEIFGQPAIDYEDLIVLVVNMTVDPLIGDYDTAKRQFVAVTTTTDVLSTSDSDISYKPRSALPIASALARPWRWSSLGKGRDPRISFPSRADKFFFKDREPNPRGWARPLDHKALYADRQPPALGSDRDRLAQPLDDLAADLLLYRTPRDEKANPTWAHALENALRLPGELGRRLQLAHFLETANALSLAQTLRLPSFQAEAHEIGKTIVAEASRKTLQDDHYIHTLLPQLKRQCEDQHCFLYRLSFKEQPEATLDGVLLLGRIHRFPARKFEASDFHPFLDNKLWVRFPAAYDYWSGRDWFTQIAPDVAFAANLAAHFAAAVKAWAPNVANTWKDGAVPFERALFRAQMRLMLEGAGLGVGAEKEQETAGQIPTAWTAQSVLRRAGADNATFEDGVDGPPPGSHPLREIWLALVGVKTPPIELDTFALKLVQAVRAVIAARTGAPTAPPTKANDDPLNNNPDYKRVNDVLTHHFTDAPRAEGLALLAIADRLSLLAKLYDDPAVAAELLVARWKMTVDLKGLDAKLAARASEINLRSRLILDTKAIRSFWGSTKIEDLATLDENLAAAVSAGIETQTNGQRPSLSVRTVRRGAFMTIMGRFDALVGQEVVAVPEWKKLRRLVAVEILNAVRRIGGDADHDGLVADGRGLPTPKPSAAPLPADEKAIEKQLGSRLSTPNPQPLVFQIGNIVKAGDIERLAGFGVLAQRVAAGADPSRPGLSPWYCLTLGRLESGTLSGPANSAASHASQPDKNVLGFGHNPWRVIDQAGFTAWVVSYHGLPLTARPVLLDLFDTDGYKSAADASLYAVLQILSKTIKAHKDEFRNWDKLLALAYGRTCRYAFFAQTYAGAFSPALSRNGDPTALKLPSGNDPVGDLHPQKASFFITARYLRRTPIGAPTLSAPRRAEPPPNLDRKPQPPNALAFPQPQRDGDWPVYPLAEDLVGRGLLVASPTDASDALIDKFEHRTRPTSDEIGSLALLTPQSQHGVKWGPNPKIWDTGPTGMPSAASFLVGRPSTSVSDWVLWRTRDLDFPSEDPAQVRLDIATILQSFHSVERKAAKDGAPATADAPDDPAVERIVIRITKIDLDANPPRSALGQWGYAWTRPDKLIASGNIPPRVPMDHWRSPPLTVTVTALAADAGAETPQREKRPGLQVFDLRVSASGTHVEAKQPDDRMEFEFFIAEGAIYRFEFFSAVKRDLFADSADNGASEVARIRTLRPLFTTGSQLQKSPAPEILSISGVDYALVAKNVVTIEVARADFVRHIGRKAVFEGTDILSVSPAAFDIGVCNAKNKDWLFWQAKRAILNRQLWGWSGRAYAHSVGDLAAGLKALVKPGNPGRLIEPADKQEDDGWARFVDEDGAWFGDRADVDSTISSGLLLPPSSDPKVSADAPSSVALQSGPRYRISLDHDPRAQYWRFSTRLESRYAGLMAADTRAKQGRVRGPWRRLLIKARPKAQLPKPKLRFILPLTEPFELGGDGARRDAPPVSSLLVLLDEQWGESAGFAEMLEAEMVHWQDDVGTVSGKPTKQDPTSPYQAGFDPIASRRKFPQLDAGALKPLQVASWPVGLTFDANVDRPRPAATAFQVRLDPNWIALAGGSDAAVWVQDVFVMTRFRRKLAPDFAAISEPEAFASDWTEPEWVVFNADARFWRLCRKGKAPVYARADELCLLQNGTVALLPTGNEKPVPAALLPNHAEKGSQMERRLFALVTRVLSEADGGRAETFEAIGEILTEQSLPAYIGLNNDPVPAPSAASTPPTPADRRLRLIEVELHKNFAELYNREYGDVIRKQQDTEVALSSPKSKSLDAPYAAINFVSGASHWLWDFLFPKPAPDTGEARDALARIRRISPPIRSHFDG